MRYFSRSALLSNIAIALFAALATFSCIPIRKQLILTDKDKHTLRTKQIQDTIVNVPSYEHRIKRGDVLSVQVSSVTPGEYKLDNTIKAGGDVATQIEPGYLVNDSGYVEVPVIGQIRVEGLTINECRVKVRQVANELLNNATVTLKLLSFEVTVIGEVKTPMTINAHDGKLTIIEAIVQARGPGDFANIQRIKVIRQVDGGTRLHVFYADISNLDVVNRPEYYLRPNDILVLEPSRVKNTNTNIRNNIALFGGILSLFLLVYNFAQIASK